MDFSFDELKKMYVLNSVKKDADGNCYVVDRIFKNPKDDVNPEHVMFSYAWVDSVLYCINSSSMDIDNEFDYIFGEDIKKVYKTIMECSKFIFKNTNSIEKDELINMVKHDDSLEKQSYLIVEGLYQNDNYNSFFSWIKSSVDYELDTNNENNNCDGNKHI